MQLLHTLQNIASNVQIKSSDLCIIHPNCQPVELPGDIVTQVQKMSQEIQYKYLNSLLQNFIYDNYYNGLIVREASKAVKTDCQILETTDFVEIDWEFYEKLHKNNKGEGWFNPNCRVLRQENDGSLAVQKLGLTIHIQRDRHLQLADQSATVGDLVAIWMPPGNVQKEFYMAIGDAAGNFSSPEDYSNKVVFVYFNFSPEGAVAVMKGLTTRLNGIKVPFSFKVLYNPSSYGRYDSGILRFDKDSYELVWQVLQTVYAENKLHFQTKVPLFTKVLAPGLALAEEPEHKFTPQETFGMNRCQIVVNGLLEAQQKGDESPEARMTSILKHFNLLGIDLRRPYLNPNSEDIYTPLG